MLHDVVSVVERSLGVKKYALAAFLDIQEAFNNVETEAIEAALVKAQVERSVTSAIVSLLNPPRSLRA